MRLGPPGGAWLAFTLLFALSPAATPLEAQRIDGPPNIVFILADDLGIGDVGVYGQQTIRTPRLDRMAREGMRFTQHYAGAPVCAPSRSVLMTGLHAGHTPVRGNFSAAGERVPLAPDDVTVAEVLRGAGYATGVVGKWGLGEEGTSGVPNAQGFDLFYGYLNQAHAHTHYPTYLYRNTAREEIPENASESEGVYSHDLFLREALGFIDRNRARPFFLYLALTLPHAEVRAPSVDVAAYADGLPEKEATFAAMVTRLDRDVGSVLDRITALGLAANTLVFFTSDNGPHGEDGHDPTYFQSSGGLRGIKRDLYEGGIRVPMLAWWPGSVAAGSVTDHPSAFWDFFATAADLARVQAPPATDGVSFGPTLRGLQQDPPARMYWEFYEGVPTQAVRLGRWKAIRRPMAGGPVELYNLETDAAESRDVAAQNPEIVASAIDAMNESHLPSPFWPTAPN